MRPVNERLTELTRLSLCFRLFVNDPEMYLTIHSDIGPVGFCHSGINSRFMQ